MAGVKAGTAYVDVVPDFSRFNKDIDKATSGAKSRFSSIGKAAVTGLGAVAGFQVLKRGIGAAVGEFQEARKVGAQTTAVLKSTGGAAKVTARDVGTLATALSKKAGVDDEAIQSGENLLLTFTKVRNETGKGNDVFNRATKIALDMSSALGQDMKSSAIQVGKALNDPIKGVTALQRVGVSFTAKQKDQIKTLVDSGQELKAQKLILRELNTEFGGAAAAKATSLDHLKVSVGNLAEAAGAVLVPAFDKVARFLSKLLNGMIEGKGVGGAMVSTFKTIGLSVGDVIAKISGLVGWFKQHKTVTLALAAAVGVLVAAFVGFKVLAAVQAAIVAVRFAMVSLNTAFLTNPIVLAVAALAALAAGFVVAYRKSEAFRNIVNTAWSVLKNVAAAVYGFVTSLGDLPGKLVAAGSAVVGGFISGIKALPGLLADVATWLWDKLKAGIESYLSAYKAAGSWLLDRIVEGFKVITGLLGSVGGWLLGRISAFVKLEIAGVKAIGSWVLDRIVEGFKAVTGLFGTVGGWLKNRFVDFIHMEIDGMKNIGGWLLNRIVDGFKTVTKLLDTVGDWLRGRFWDVINGVKDGFVSIGGKIIGWIADGFKAGLNAVIDFANLIIHVINKIPGIPDIPDIGHVGGGGGGGSGGKSDPTPHKRAQRGGPINIGAPSGDTVPAMLERGEYVLNREAVKRAGRGALDRLNFGLAPRFQAGGLLPGYLGLAQGGGIFQPDAITFGSDAGKYIKQLPGAGSLPGWIHGLGTYVLGKVASWIKTKVNSIISSGASPGGDTAGGGTSGANQALAKKMMIAMGWPSGQWPALRALWMGESGFRTTARNQSSGAYGIPQALPASKMGSAGPDWLTNPATQIKWGLGYIKARYGSPAHAYDLWTSRMPHWYAKGGIVPSFHGGGWVKPPGGQREMNARLLRGEYVLDADTAAAAARGGAPFVVQVVVEDGAVDARRIRVISQDEMRRSARAGARALIGAGGIG